MSTSRRATVGRPWQWAGGLLVLALVAFGAWRLSSSGAREPDEGGATRVAAGTPSFTVFVLGGSTASGEPYAPRLDFGLVASWLLGGRVGDRPIRVVNRGGPGKPSCDVVDDAREIAGERFEPGTAVAFLYLGNNEFLRFDAEHDLSAPERMLFDKPTTITAVREGVLRSYGENIARIIESLQGAGVGVIASTMAVNMKDWEPNRSVLAKPANAAAVQRLLEDGERAQAAGDAEAALGAYEEILELEPLFALASKEAGDCARLLGRIAEARAHYQRAVDHDGNLYRETSRQERILRATCERYKVPVVDAVKLLEAMSPDGLIGFESMWDNCHPTLEGYARIAEGFVGEMERMLGLRRQRATLDLSELERALGIDDAFLTQVLANRGQYCYVTATLTFDPSARLARGEHYLNQALARSPEDADLICSLAILSAMKGDTEASLAQWRKAYGLDPRLTRKRAKHPHVREVMQRNGIGNLPDLLKS